MTRKLPAWILTVDDDCGHDATVYIREEDFHAALTKIMEERLDYLSRCADIDDDTGERMESCQNHIREGRIWDAWEVFRDSETGIDPLHDTENYYYIERQDIEIPAAEATLAQRVLAWAAETGTAMPSELLAEVAALAGARETTLDALAKGGK